MKRILFFAALSTLCFQGLYAQSNILLEYPNAQPVAPEFYSTCNFYDIVQTKDKGFVLSYMPYAPNIHAPLPVDYITIKTDSNFVPLWKKRGFYKAISLPTGGIILISAGGASSPVYASTIEKITASGQLVWQKKIDVQPPQETFISDAVGYNDKVSFAGSHSCFTPIIGGNFMNGFLLTLDTNGAVVTKVEYGLPNGASESFNRMLRDNAGNFIVSGKTSIIKFDAAFNILWDQGWSDTYAPGISDIMILSNGDLFCSGGVKDTSTSYDAAAFLKFSSSGAFIFEKHFSSSPSGAGNLVRIPNGHFVLNYREGLQTYQDSVSLMSVDSNANVIWTKKYQKALNWGPGKLIKNKLYFPLYTKDPAIFSVNTEGSNSCGSLALTKTLVTGTHTQSSHTLLQITSTVQIVSDTLSPANQSQTYVSKCNSTVGLSENNIEESFSMYPNPAQDVLFIEIPSIEEPVALSIYNSLGTEVRQENLQIKDQKAMIKTEGLASGVYIVAIKSARKVTLSKRLVITN